MNINSTVSIMKTGKVRVFDEPSQEKINILMDKERW